MSKILVTDDMEDILFCVCGLLDDFPLVQTTQSVEAIDIIGSQDIVLVVSDFEFNNQGFTGMDIYDAFRTKHPDRPFIFHTTQCAHPQLNFKHPYTRFVEKVSSDTVALHKVVSEEYQKILKQLQIQ